jgi:uncharacterized protein
MILTEEQRTEVEANRRQYEALKAAGQGNAPKALPQPTHRDGAPIAASAVIHHEVIPAGWYWTTRLNQGETLRIVNAGGTSCVSLLAWNRNDISERLNYADTIKVQWTAELRKGRVILSDMGRVLFSIVEDTGAGHDTLAGCSTAATNAARYGAGFRNSRDNFILAAGKLGLERRDVHACVSFFAPVQVQADGALAWNGARRTAGDFINLRAEMDLLIALSNCPHPLDPATAYPAKPVDIIRYRGAPASEGDLCRTASAEAIRAFENNAFVSGTTGGAA